MIRQRSALLAEEGRSAPRYGELRVKFDTPRREPLFVVTAHYRRILHVGDVGGAIMQGLTGPPAAQYTSNERHAVYLITFPQLSAIHSTLSTYGATRLHLTGRSTTRPRYLAAATVGRPDAGPYYLIYHPRCARGWASDAHAPAPDRNSDMCVSIPRTVRAGCRSLLITEAVLGEGEFC